LKAWFLHKIRPSKKFPANAKIHFTFRIDAD